MHLINQPPTANQRAIHNFQRAKRRAFTEEMLATIRFTPVDLLSFEDVQQQLKLANKHYRGLQEVSLNHIVGSVNRSDDFTRTFMPRKDSIQLRWQQIERLMASTGWPPIELYQVSWVYFVKDGHHRVSVMRQQEAEAIEAYVWEYDCRVPLWPDDDRSDIKIRADYLAFLERTQLDKFRPLVEIILTSRGSNYWLFDEEIAIHRYYLGLEQNQDPSFQEAMLDWYDTIYTPLVDQLRQDDVLAYFPGRTEADLALHIFAHQYWLEEQQDEGEDEVTIEAATEDFAERIKRNPWRRLQAWVNHRVLGKPVYWPEELPEL